MPNTTARRCPSAMPMCAALLCLLSALALSLSGCSATAGAPPVSTATTGSGGQQTSPTASGGSSGVLPHFDHIVVVVEENHSYGDIVGASDAPYINALSQRGAVFTHSYAVTHPSEPNYLALFAGSTFGIASDDCPQQLGGPNLASELIGNGKSFIGYSESMPAAGFTGCRDGDSGGEAVYARKHNPWVNFAGVPAASNQPFTSFPSDFSQLPTVAFVVPNQQHDMHSASIADGDTWLQQNLDAYAQWAPTHNSLLIVTWDEDDGSQSNQVLTMFVGAHVQPGEYGETINHYSVLRTIEALEGLPFTNRAANATTITDVWQR